MLGVDEVENPEDQLQISPRDWGSLVHQALEDFIAEVLARHPGDRAEAAPTLVGVRSGPDGRDRRERVCDHYESHGLTGRPVFWQRDKKRIIADLERFLQAGQRAPRRHRHLARSSRAGVRFSSIRSSARSRCIFPTGEASTSGVLQTGSTSAPTPPSTSSITRRASLMSIRS